MSQTPPNNEDAASLTQRIAALEAEVKGKDIAYRRAVEERNTAQKELGSVQTAYQQYEQQVQATLKDMEARPLYFAEQFNALAQQRGQLPGVGGSGHPEPEGDSMPNEHVRNLQQSVLKQGETWAQQQARIDKNERDMAELRAEILAQKNRYLEQQVQARAEQELKGYTFKSERVKQAALTSVIQNLKAGMATWPDEILRIKEDYAIPAAADTGLPPPAPKTPAQAPPKVDGSPISGPVIGGEPGPDKPLETREDLHKFLEDARADVAKIFAQAPSDDYGDGSTAS